MNDINSSSASNQESAEKVVDNFFGSLELMDPQHLESGLANAELKRVFDSANQAINDSDYPKAYYTLWVLHSLKGESPYHNVERASHCVFESAKRGIVAGIYDYAGNVGFSTPESLAYVKVVHEIDDGWCSVYEDYEYAISDLSDDNLNAIDELAELYRKDIQSAKTTLIW